MIQPCVALITSSPFACVFSTRCRRRARPVWRLIGRGLESRWITAPRVIVRLEPKVPSVTGVPNARAGSRLVARAAFEAAASPGQAPSAQLVTVAGAVEGASGWRRGPAEVPLRLGPSALPGEVIAWHRQGACSCWSSPRPIRRFETLFPPLVPVVGDLDPRIGVIHRLAGTLEAGPDGEMSTRSSLDASCWSSRTKDGAARRKARQAGVSGASSGPDLARASADGDPNGLVSTRPPE